MPQFYPGREGDGDHIAPVRRVAQTRGMWCSAKYDNTTDGFIAHAQRTGAIFFLSLVIWAVAGFGSFWPALVLLVLGMKLGVHARRVYFEPAVARGQRIER